MRFLAIGLREQRTPRPTPLESRSRRRFASRVSRPALERLEPRLLLSTTSPAALLPELDRLFRLAADVHGLIGPPKSESPAADAAGAGAASQAGVAGAGAEIARPNEGDVLSTEPDTPPGVALTVTSDPASISPDDLAAAKSLPDVEFTEVDGQFDPSLAPKYFKVPIDATTGSLTFEMVSSDPKRPLREHVSVFDESGQNRGTVVAAPGSLSFVFNFFVSDDPPGLGERPHALFLRIAMPLAPPSPRSVGPANGGSGAGIVPTVATDSSPAGFVLFVSRQAVNEFTRLVDEQAITLAQGASGADSSSSSRGERSALDAGGTAAPVVEVAQPSEPYTGRVAIATGPLPSRSAAALGGVFASGDPVPVVSPTDETALDLPFIDGDLLDAPSVLPDTPTIELEAPLEPAGALVSLRGSGGFPLLGSSLITDKRPGAMSEGGLPLVSFGEELSPLPVAAGEVFDREKGSEGLPARERARIRSRISVLAVISVAFGLTSGLIAPDLVDRLPMRRSGRSAVRKLLSRWRGRGT
jgi:hypothetical protein